jgi:YVTN family beta-propeller protein
MRIQHLLLIFALMMAATLILSGCGGASSSHQVAVPSTAATSSTAAANPTAIPTQRRIALSVTNHIVNVYAAADSMQFNKVVDGFPERVYVPNNLAGTADVIDPATYKVIAHFRVGRSPQHITPSWDLKHLYVNNTAGNSLTVIDPQIGTPTETIPIPDPYNLYFTPDGSKAIVVSERLRRLDFRDARTWDLIKSVAIPWRGVDHLDFSADGSYLLASTEFSGELVRVDVVAMAVTSEVKVGGLAVDVKLAPDGTVFYVANQLRDGVSVIDPQRMREISFIPTGPGAHGLYVSRDAKRLYVSNRRAGSISVIDFATRRVSATWAIGGSPDMIQLSPDGRELWVSNRSNASVSVVDTVTGRLLHVIKVGAGPHGLSYFPQPGRFSLGHNGVYR